MKIVPRCLFLLMLITISVELDACIICPPDIAIAESDSVSIIKITTANCVSDKCDSLNSDNIKLDAGIIQYSFICNKALRGGCPDNLTFNHTSGYCVSCNYIAVAHKNKLTYLFELRRDDSRVVHNRSFTHPIEVHDSESPKTEWSYQYYELSDFLALVDAIWKVRK